MRKEVTTPRAATHLHRDTQQESESLLRAPHLLRHRELVGTLAGSLGVGSRLELELRCGLCLSCRCDGISHGAEAS